MDKITTVGIDLAKRVFALHAVDANSTSEMPDIPALAWRKQAKYLDFPLFLPDC